MIRRLLLASCLAALAIACGPTGRRTDRLLARLGGAPCPDSAFTCIEMEVPLDHFDPESSRQLRVTFAVHAATGHRRGMLVTATGGPGSSGILSADAYMALLDPALVEHFDLVFFDQRGVNLSGGLQCPNAAARYYRTDTRADTPEREQGLVQAVRAFAEACFVEMGSPEGLEHYSTRQAVEDLEAFRRLVGEERFHLYGESYGTQFSQVYAAHHGAHVESLILDGTIDTMLSGPEFAVSQAGGFQRTLESMLSECASNAGCAAEFGVDPAVAYSEVCSELEAAPAVVPFPLPSGEIVEREFTYADLEMVVGGGLYDEAGRTEALSIVAAAHHGNWLPLARATYAILQLDPVTLEAGTDPSWSDAAYYATTCADYRYFDGAPEERAEQYLRTGDAWEDEIRRMRSVLYGDMACTYWPAQGEDEPVLAAPAGPVLVLGSTADPATPVEQGIAVYERTGGARLITRTGGPHVIYGRGDACPDELVNRLLLRDELPEREETSCPGPTLAPWIARGPVSLSDTLDALDALVQVETAMLSLPEYAGWDGAEPLRVGCDFGGSVEFAWMESRAAETLSLDRCSMLRGLALSGRGTAGLDVDQMLLDVHAEGEATGALSYLRSGGLVTLDGSLNGRNVHLSRLLE